MKLNGGLDIRFDTIRDAIITCNLKPTYAQKYRYTVQGIHGVSPEEEKEGYGGNCLQKRKVLSLECKSEGVVEY